MNGGKALFVVESGWVFLAEGFDKVGGEYRLRGASTIRRWGTTKGLGELSLSGPTKDTVLDPCGNPIIPVGKVLFLLPCTY